MNWRRKSPRVDPGKLSARLLEFARPIFAALAPEPTIDRARAILQLAIPIWNAQILEQRGTPADLIEDLRRRVKEGETPELAFLVAQLFQRKAELFPDDMRVVGDWELKPDGNGGWDLRAEPARPP